VSAVTYLSVIHGAPYTGAATVYLNDTLITQSAGINTGSFSPKYGTIRPGTYAAKFKKAGTDSVLDQLTASRYDTLGFYTLLLYNSADKAAHVLKITDDYSGVGNLNAYYRFFNLAPDYPSVNVYFNGNLVQQARGQADNAYNNSLNGFQGIQAGSYVITVKDAATDSVIVTSPAWNLVAGNPFTVWITGLKSNKTLSINILQAQY
jgi:hypothetical protein